MGQHWYDKDGTPKYTIVGKNGKERDVTLRDARKEGYGYGVTTILKSASKDNLTNWITEQALLLALNIPMSYEETEQEWAKRIIEMRQQQQAIIMNKGSKIHDALESYFKNESYKDEYKPYVDAAIEVLRKELSDVDFTKAISEQAFYHSAGFGGKIDLYIPEYEVIIDFKTKDSDDIKKFIPYPEHAMQLAAYGEGLGFKQPRCYNLYISALHPNIIKLHTWTKEDVDRYRNMFYHLLEYTKLMNQYDPAKVNIVEDV